MSCAVIPEAPQRAARFLYGVEGAQRHLNLAIPHVVPTHTLLVRLNRRSSQQDYYCRRRILRKEM